MTSSRLRGLATSGLILGTLRHRGCLPQGIFRVHGLLLFVSHQAPLSPHCHPWVVGQCE